MGDFAPHNMTADNLPIPFVASASSWLTLFGGFPAYKIFDGLIIGSNDYWVCDGSTGWIGLDIGIGNKEYLGSYIVQFDHSIYPNRAPKDWTMQGSNNGVDWDVLDSVIGETSWGTGEKRTFTCDTITTEYRYFRLDVTLNNGDSNYIQIGETFLYNLDPVVPILKTIGSGGDFATVELAYAFLVALGAMIDDYIFDLISTVTINAWIGLSKIDCNGHTVLFTCSHNEAIPDRPDLWYRAILSGANGYMDLLQDLGATINDEIHVEWLYYKQATIDNIVMLQIRTQQSSDVMTWSIKNCWFEGHGTITELGVGVSSTNARHYYNIENIAMFNIYSSLSLCPGGFIGGDDFPDRKHVKDVTIITGTNAGIGVSLGDLPGNNVYFENVEVFHTGTSGVCWTKNIGSEPGRHKLSHCSDDDDSMLNIAPSAIMINNVPNIVIGDNIKSVDPTDLGKGFLELINGVRTIFQDGSESFSGGSIDLGRTGIDSGLEKDIYGRAVPGVDKLFSIGAFKQQYDSITGISSESFRGDLKLFFEQVSHLVSVDIRMTDDLRDAVQDQTFETSVIISLFTDRRAGVDDVIPGGTDNKRGWVGDEVLNSLFTQDIIIGSKLWLLSRSKMNQDLLNDTKEYAEEALQWMLNFNIAEKIEVTVTKIDMEWINMGILIYRPGDDKVSFKYIYNWIAQIVERG